VTGRLIELVELEGLLRLCCRVVTVASLRSVRSPAMFVSGPSSGNASPPHDSHFDSLRSRLTPMSGSTAA
jgi:hypothetical protein